MQSGINSARLTRSHKALRRAALSQHNKSRDITHFSTHTPMKSLAQTISSLEARRESLQRELAAIGDRLAAVAKLLDASSGTETTHATTVGGFGRSASGKKRAAGRARRAWFERGEAAKLLSRAAKKAKPAADLVRDVAAMKGYNGQLSADDMRRFEGAVFMAIEHAVKVGVLKRRKDRTLLAA